MNNIIINKDEVLRYLGYKNQELDGITNGLIDESIEEIKQLIKEKYSYKFFDIARDKERIWIKDTNLMLLGKDINRHLIHSKSCILMAVTLGHEVDMKIRYYEKTSMTKAMILDACAGAAIEEICDQVNTKLEIDVSKENKTLTSRYSPGYGDLPIEMQNDLLDVLGTKKNIGLSATSENILIPRKSVTAIIGIIDEKHKKEENRCLNCNKYHNCSYRKGDTGDGN
jgi:hypothetical protein